MRKLASWLLVILVAAVPLVFWQGLFRSFGNTKFALVGAISAAVIWLVLLDKSRFARIWSRVYVPLFLYGLAMAHSLFGVAHPARGVFVFLQQVALLSLVPVASVVFDDANARKRLIWGALASSVVVAIVGVLQWRGFNPTGLLNPSKVFPTRRSCTEIGKQTTTNTIEIGKRVAAVLATDLTGDAN